MLTTLRRIEPVSLAKIYAVIYAALMFLIGLPYGCIGAVVGSQSELGGLGAGLGLAAIVVLPVMGAVMGFVGGLVFAFIYNLVAERVGGVQIEIDPPAGSEFGTDLL